MLFAVHISDGILTWPWLAGGFALAGLLLAIACYRLRDDEIPRIALLTAVFFVASLIHVPPMSIHLLLNGLVGVLLGWRSALAVCIGLLLQVVLFRHGGFLTLGINACVMTTPALLCFGFYRLLHRIPWTAWPMARIALVGIGAIVWTLSAVYSVALLCNTSQSTNDNSAFHIANEWIRDPWVLLGTAIVAIAAVILERRLENAPEFPLGFLIGELSVLLSAVLNCVVLIAGNEEHWPVAPLLLVIAHLPIALVEGVVLGFLMGFLTKVKPAMLGSP